MFKTIRCASVITFAALNWVGPAHAVIVHDGGPFDTALQFQAIGEAVKEGEAPWLLSFNKLRANSHDSTAYTSNPVQTLVRGATRGGPVQNYSRLYNDAAAAYALALDYQISGDTTRATRAVAILNAWGQTLTSITGSSDRFLASGIYGYQLAVAAETLRSFPGWKQTDQAAFGEMLTNVFAPMNQSFLTNHNGAKIDHYWANWDLSNVASLMAIGIFVDRTDLYGQAKNYYLYGAGNGSILHAAWKLYPDGTAQWQESGRDQAHTMLGLGLAGTISALAWHQGDDLYSADGNRLLAAARYVAKYNLGLDVPYTTYTNSDVTQTTISSVGRGQDRPIWSLLCYHYVVTEGLYAPELTEEVQMSGADGGGGDYGPNSGGYDQLGYGTLTFDVPPSTAAVPEPVSASLLGAGIVAVAASRRGWLRRNRTSKSF